MATSWEERPGMARITAEAETYYYVLQGVSNRTEARILALGYTPLIRNNLYRSDVLCNEVGCGVYYLEVTWGTKHNREPMVNEFTWDFDTTGATKHIEHGLATADSYTEWGKYERDLETGTYSWTGLPVNPEIPELGDRADNHTNHNCLINVDADGNVNGADVPTSTFQWGEHHSLLLADYSFLYATQLTAYTGMINSEVFRGFPAQSVLFLGARGGMSRRDPSYLELDYFFHYSKPTTDESLLAIGPITGVRKAGWDYLWVEKKLVVDEVSQTTTAIPKQVDVIRTFETFDFSLLGIGTSAPIDVLGM